MVSTDNDTPRRNIFYKGGRNKPPAWTGPGRQKIRESQATILQAVMRFPYLSWLAVLSVADATFVGNAGNAMRIRGKSAGLLALAVSCKDGKSVMQHAINGHRSHSAPWSSSHSLLGAPWIVESTVLKYKSGREGEDAAVFTPPKRPRGSSASKAKRKAKKKRATLLGSPTNGSRSYQVYAKARGPVDRDELARHLQSVFSDLREFGGDGGDDDIILTDSGSDGGVSSMTSASTKQLSSLKNLDRHPALVLNADYQPLRMLPLSKLRWQETVKAVLSGKAVVVDVYPNVYVRSVGLDMPVPSVIALREYAPTGKARPAFTRRNVFLRDGYRCQYCGQLFRTSDLSLDHVQPRCLGGKLNWENAVTCCKKCNGRKGSLRPNQLHTVGMKLLSTPRCPSQFELLSEASKFVPRRVHPTWAPFLGSSDAEDMESANS